MSSENLIKNEKLTYALDIGTRNVIGMVGKVQDSKVQIIAVETQPHAKRTMMDGQIEDIDMVASVVKSVTAKLEEKLDVRLSSACVAAAGRALRTEKGTSTIEFETPQTITAENISKLEAIAVSNAESALKTEKDQRMYLVGYTSTQSLIDKYPMRSMLGHVGSNIQTTIVATFLPSEVIESLYAVMNKAGLEVASLTLEPIAALNAAIPAELRLLNLALVDIGAGTSDIAICREGTVIGYTMATVAGDEITEALMKKLLVDYNTAERIKAALNDSATVDYTDILGIEQTITAKEIEECIKQATNALVGEIAQRIKQVNDGVPSAVFLAGGGSKLNGLCHKIATALEMDDKRVAIAGGHFKVSAFSKEFDIITPEYTTPLGIAISAALGLISDSYRVTLNSEAAKLFRSGSLTALEILMMNGYTYQDLLGKNGKNLVVEIDGVRKVFAGEPATPATLKVNGKPAQPSLIINAGDKIDFIPAVAGKDAHLTVQELLQKTHATAITVNGIHMQPEESVKTGAVVVVLAKAAQIEQTYSTDKKEQNEKNKEKVETTKIDDERKESAVKTTTAINKNNNECVFILNDNKLVLPRKENNEAYMLMDFLQYTDIDFDKVTEPVELFVNGQQGAFSQVVKENDVISIKCIQKQHINLSN